MYIYVHVHVSRKDSNGNVFGQYPAEGVVRVDGRLC